MSPNPFDPTFDRLPGTLPIFPLADVLLLPRARLPLNVFEPRYLAMVEDAMAAGNRMIGMIQPSDPGDRSSEPAVYGMGCAGRVTSFSETDDGRYLITLTGTCRFNVAEELATTRGYRRVVPDWSPFESDLDPPGEVELDRPRLVGGLRAYFKQNGLTANWDAVENTPDERLINSLSMICPLSASEKQALLEAPDLGERARLMITMIEMAVFNQNDGNTSARH
ncbi:MAG TPA: LON peptidase substrate-binding domain-containing protein [Arenibaculum sp.]|nr:LON peptidase substrate-binding domain-containing protein [Arenibaculum sp.]